MDIVPTPVLSPLTAPVSVISVSPPRNWYRQFVMAGQQPVLKSFYHWLLQVSVSLSSVSTTRASTLEFSIACILALTNQTLLLSRARQNCDVMTNPQPRLFFFTCCVGCRLKCSLYDQQRACPSRWLEWRYSLTRLLSTDTDQKLILSLSRYFLRINDHHYLRLMSRSLPICWGQEQAAKKTQKGRPAAKLKELVSKLFSVFL